LYTQKALESNIILVNIIAVTTLLWLFSRSDLKKSLSPLVTILLFAIAFRSFWLDGILLALNFGQWSSLFAKGVTSVIGFGLPTIYLYSTMSHIV
jgi:hypothetical protein